MNASGTTPRMESMDLLKGLIIVLMALDHAAMFIARAHPEEYWGLIGPDYPTLLAFLTRYLTHICAPGFFFLMGAGMTMVVASRQHMGWSDGRISRFFLTRGVMLMIFQQILENPAWIMSALLAQAPVDTYSHQHMPGGGGEPMIGLGVLSALGSAMVIWGLLWRLNTVAIAAVSVGAIIVTQLVVPGPDAVDTLYGPLMRVLFLPGLTAPLLVVYPVVPWMGVVGLGLVFGRCLLADRNKTLVRGVRTGAIMLLLFVVTRFAGGFGNFNPYEGEGLLDFFNIVKYPPSLAFLLITLGLNLLLLGLLDRHVRLFRTWAKPLLVFGQVPLFFYITHLWLYDAIGLAFPRGTGLPFMYLMWLLGLAVLLPLCAWYGRWKRLKPRDSLWRAL